MHIYDGEESRKIEKPRQARSLRMPESYRRLPFRELKWSLLLPPINVVRENLRVFDF